MKRAATKPISSELQTTEVSAQISNLYQHLADEFQPENFFLFGSHAYGQPHCNSDIDLLVVMPFQGSPFRQAGLS